MIERTFHNLFTVFGLNALASAPSNDYTPPAYLALNGPYITLAADVAIGAKSVTLTGNPTVQGDTQIVLSAGLSNQEAVPFSTITGTGPYTVTLATPTTKSHAASDPVTRQVSITDTAAQIIAPIQYDPVNAPRSWPSASSSYSSGTGQWTMQFHFSPGQAAAFIATAGLIDAQNIGSGNLHSHAIVGLDARQTTSEFEIDINLTYQNTPQ